MGVNILTELSGLSSLLSGSASTAVPILNAIGLHLQGNSNTNTSLSNLLMQMHDNPAAAPTYAALIAALPNVPEAVLVEINGAVAVATDKVAFAQALTRAQAALAASNSTSAIGGLLAGLSVPA
jgi:hypothetical protein